MTKFDRRKIGQGHRRVFIYMNFVEPESMILHAQFQDHMTSGSGEGDFLKVFTRTGMINRIRLIGRYLIEKLLSI